MIASGGLHGIGMGRLAMGEVRNRSSTSDLFVPGTAPVSPSAKVSSSSSPINDADPHIALPRNLPTSLKHIEDDELDRLLAAVLAEQKRRGRKLPVLDESPPKRRAQAIPLPLTSGKLNAVCAAFKAGITPSRIARQFGISQSDVRKALASTDAKR